MTWVWFFLAGIISIPLRGRIATALMRVSDADMKPLSVLPLLFFLFMGFIGFMIDNQLVHIAGGLAGVLAIFAIGENIRRGNATAALRSELASQRRGVKSRIQRRIIIPSEEPQSESTLHRTEAHVSELLALASKDWEGRKPDAVPQESLAPEQHIEDEQPSYIAQHVKADPDDHLAVNPLVNAPLSQNVSETDLAAARSKLIELFAAGSASSDDEPVTDDEKTVDELIDQVEEVVDATIATEPVTATEPATLPKPAQPAVLPPPPVTHVDTTPEPSQLKPSIASTVRVSGPLSLGLEEGPRASGPVNLGASTRFSSDGPVSLGKSTLGSSGTGYKPAVESRLGKQEKIDAPSRDDSEKKPQDSSETLSVKS